MVKPEIYPFGAPFLTGIRFWDEDLRGIML